MGNISEERINLKLNMPIKAIIKGEIICCIDELRVEWEKRDGIVYEEENSKN